jgi:uncharacterized damage-inducible protein DinB
MDMTLGQLFLKELEAEAPATRKCLERVPEKLFSWKPHEKSMIMGYLALMMADIPKWLTAMITGNEINFATWEKYTPTTTADLLTRFDKNMEDTREALKAVSDAELQELFYLKSGDQVLMTMPKVDSVSSTLNHWVHHRGQLTVYLRLNDIAVPAIYGPSADDKTF